MGSDGDPKRETEDKFVAEFRAPRSGRGPGMLLKHSGTLIYVLLDTKITKIRLISAEICFLALNLTETV